MCSNCVDEHPEAFEVLPEKKYNACPKCAVTYAKNRNGIAFLLDEDVMIKEYHKGTNDRIFTIKGIYIMEECESGRMIYLIDKETERPLKSVLDTNWLIKLN